MPAKKFWPSLSVNSNTLLEYQESDGQNFLAAIVYPITLSCTDSF
jgi:hypothetical protein